MELQSKYGAVNSANETNGDQEDEDPEMPDADFEDILDIVGHGFYQVKTFVLLSMPDFCVAMSQVFFIFSNALPSWRCAAYKNGALGVQWSRSMDKCIVNGSSCQAFEFSTEYVSIVTEWNLLCDYAYIPHLTITIQFLGLAFGCCIFGQLSDSYGRKLSGTVALTCLAVCDIFVGASPNWMAFSAARFLVGVFAGGVLGVFCVYTIEFVGTRWRVFFAMIGPFAFGHMTLALIAMTTHDWRRTSYIIGAVKIPFCFLIAGLAPESPRWLIQKHKFVEAALVIDRMAKWNRRPKFTDFELLHKVARTEASRAKQALSYTYLDLFRTRQRLLMTLSLCVLWFSVGEIYYGITILTDTFAGDLFINAIVMAALIYPAKLIAVPVFLYVARKTSYYWFVSLTIIPMTLIVILSVSSVLSPDSIYVSILVFTGQCFVGSMWGLVGLMTVENYPTLMRGLAFGAGNTSCRIGGMLAPQIALLGTVTHWTLPYIFHAIFATVSVFLLWRFVPETLNVHLPEEVLQARGSNLDSEAVAKGSLIREREPKQDEK